jgi:hypothetical protein
MSGISFIFLTGHNQVFMLLCLPRSTHWRECNRKSHHVISTCPPIICPTLEVSMAAPYKTSQSKELCVLPKSKTLENLHRERILQYELYKCITYTANT